MIRFSAAHFVAFFDLCEFTRQALAPKQSQSPAVVQACSWYRAYACQGRKSAEVIAHRPLRVFRIFGFTRLLLSVAA